MGGRKPPPSSRALAKLHKIKRFLCAAKQKYLFSECLALSSLTSTRVSRCSSQLLSLAKRRYAQALEAVVVKSTQACLAAERKAVQVGAKPWKCDCMQFHAALGKPMVLCILEVPVSLFTSVLMSVCRITTREAMASH